MSITDLPLKKMSIEDKIKVMESLWEDLCKNAEDIHSPSWHKKILNSRERSLNTDEDRFIDWESAKKNIRDNIS